MLPHMVVIEDLQDPDYSSTSSQMHKNAKRLSLLHIQPFPNMMEARIFVIPNRQPVDGNTEEESLTPTLERRPLHAAAGRAKCQM